MIATVDIDSSGVAAAGFVPFYLDQDSIPRALANDAQGALTVDYVSDITREAGLNGTLHWDGDIVKFYERS